MGSKCCRVKQLLAKRDIKILMVGLDDSGKTAILNKLKIGDFVATVPTIGFHVEALEYNNITFTVWDLGGQYSVSTFYETYNMTEIGVYELEIRRLWRYYYRNTQALIFVVDSNNKQRIYEARNELHRLLTEHELSNTTIVVFANKQDLPGAMNVSEVAYKLKLHTISHRCWHIQGTSAKSGDGLNEGLKWLSDNTPCNKAKQDSSCICLQ